MGTHTCLTADVVDENNQKVKERKNHLNWKIRTVSVAGCKERRHTLAQKKLCGYNLVNSVKAV